MSRPSSVTPKSSTPITTLVVAFDADPVARWMCDDPQQYLRGPMLISWQKIQPAPGTRAVTADGVATLERLTLLHRQSTASSSATVISTGRAPARRGAAETPSLHVDAAASAALLAIEKARRVIYNVAEPKGYLSPDTAQRELGFDPSFRLTAWVT